MQEPPFSDYQVLVYWEVAASGRNDCIPVVPVGITWCATQELYPHRDVSVPCFRMNTNVASKDGWSKTVCDNGVTVAISTEVLQLKKINNLHDQQCIRQVCLLESQLLFAWVRISTMSKNWCVKRCCDFRKRYQHWNTIIPYRVWVIGCEVYAVVTVGNSKACNPLVKVWSSLSPYSRHPCFLSEIHLQPLINVISFRRPCTSSSPSSLKVQSGIWRAVITVPLRRGCDLRVRYVFALHSERLQAFCKKKWDRFSQGNSKLTNLHRLAYIHEVIKNILCSQARQ